MSTEPRHSENKEEEGLPGVSRGVAGQDVFGSPDIRRAKDAKGTLFRLFKIWPHSSGYFGGDFTNISRFLAQILIPKKYWPDYQYLYRSFN